MNLFRNIVNSKNVIPVSGWTSVITPATAMDNAFFQKLKVCNTHQCILFFHAENSIHVLCCHLWLSAQGLKSVSGVHFLTLHQNQTLVSFAGETICTSIMLCLVIVIALCHALHSLETEMLREKKIWKREKKRIGYEYLIFLRGISGGDIKLCRSIIT